MFASTYFEIFHEVRRQHLYLIHGRAGCWVVVVVVYLTTNQRHLGYFIYRVFSFHTVVNDVEAKPTFKVFSFEPLIQISFVFHWPLQCDVVFFSNTEYFFIFFRVTMRYRSAENQIFVWESCIINVYCMITEYVLHTSDLYFFSDELHTNFSYELIRTSNNLLVLLAAISNVTASAMLEIIYHYFVNPKL